MGKDKTITITKKDAQMVAAYCGNIICEKEEKQNSMPAMIKKAHEVGLYFSLVITCLFEDEVRERIVKEVTEAVENAKKQSGGVTCQAYWMSCLAA